MTRSVAVVYVVDDDESVREGVARLITSAGWEVRSFGSAQEFLETERPDQPGCLVLDVRMPGLSGLDLQEVLTRAESATPIVFITGYGDIPITVRAMKAGAVDFLAKPFEDEDLLDAIEQALERDARARAERAELAELLGRVNALTPREQEVFSLVATGLRNREIADELGITEKTIKVHRGRVMSKLAAKSLADLVRLAERAGIKPP